MTEGGRAAIRVIGSAAILLAHIAPAAAHDMPSLPQPGGAYAEVKAELLAAGLELAPDHPSHPDSRNPDLDCAPLATKCRALFVIKTAGGWGRYVVIQVQAADLRVIGVHRAFPVEGLLAIPPPPPADAPKLGGPYRQARYQLIRLGYRPMRRPWPSPPVCAVEPCRKSVRLSEVGCAEDAPICEARWRSPQGRVLVVMTKGEDFAGELYYVGWAPSRPSDPASTNAMGLR